jgi:hypothetical protein
VTADAFTMIDDEPVFHLCLIVTDSMKRRDTIQLGPRWPVSPETGNAVQPPRTQRNAEECFWKSLSPLGRMWQVQRIE